jgi:hypothetical protein
LSQFCDANDIITPIKKKDEQMRKELGFLGPQNFHIPRRQYSKLEWLSYIRTAKRKHFFHHADAQFIRNCIGEHIWNSYFKFSFERDPFDKAISRYYWSTREPRPDISQYLNAAPVNLLSNWNIYTINDQVAVDFVGRYENLDDDLAFIGNKIGLPDELPLPRAKGSYRQSREHYSKVLNAEARSRIEIVCAKELSAFNYCWTDSQA